MNQNFYRQIYLIRRVEEEIARVYPTDAIKSPVHLSIGQEAVSVGVCSALRPEDVVFGSYRGHALYLAKGGDLRAMIAELYGKVTGCGRGKAGSMHLIDAAHGMMGTSAVVATTIPIAVGYANAVRYKKEDKVVATFFGDGAVDEGAFHESMNYAALKKLPIFFVCENNFYAIHSHHLQRHHSDNLCERARSYGMPAYRIENNDTLAIYNKVKELSADMRVGKIGPIFLECMTYRWLEHVGPSPDFKMGYRTSKEGEEWMQKDELKKFATLLSAEERRAIEEEVEAQIADAFSFAERSPNPVYEDLYADIYKE